MEWHGWGPYKWPQIHGVGHFTPKKWSETTLFWGEMKKIMQLLLVILRKFPLIVHSWGGLVSYNDRWWNFRDFWDSGKSMQNCPDAVRVMLEPSIVTMVGCMVAMFSYLDLSQIKLGSLKNLNVGFVLAGLFFALVFLSGLWWVTTGWPRWTNQPVHIFGPGRNTGEPPCLFLGEGNSSIAYDCSPKHVYSVDRW